jgi:hypothetical protein
MAQEDLRVGAASAAKTKRYRFCGPSVFKALSSVQWILLEKVPLPVAHSFEALTDFSVVPTIVILYGRAMLPVHKRYTPSSSVQSNRRHDPSL